MSIILIIVLFLIIFWLIVQNVKLQQELIDPKKCPSIKGEFGVTAKKAFFDGASIATLKTCGVSSNETCFKAVNNVDEAMSYCNSYSNICNAFIYEAENKNVYIVDATKILGDYGTGDLFIRQI